MLNRFFRRTRCNLPEMNTERDAREGMIGYAVPRPGVYEVPGRLMGGVPVYWIDHAGEVREHRIVYSTHEYDETVRRFREAFHAEHPSDDQPRLTLTHGGAGAGASAASVVQRQ